MRLSKKGRKQLSEIFAVPMTVEEVNRVKAAKEKYLGSIK